MQQIHPMRELMDEGRELDFEERFMRLQAEMCEVLDENEALRRQLDEMNERIQLAEASDVKALLAKYIILRTPKNSHAADRTRHAPEVDFQLWQRGIENSYDKRIHLLQREVLELRKALFRTTMDLILKRSPGLAEIPFTYCDVNGQLLCTRAVYDLFSIQRGEELNLRGLLRHIEKEDARHIFESLQAGRRLKDYKLRDVRSISVNSYPLYYGELPVGVAMILQSPDLAIESGKMYRFVREVLSEVRSMSREYNLISSRAKRASPESDDYGCA
jgi:hypothetical protein